MTLKDVIYYACLMCGKETLAENVFKGLAPDDNAEVVRMLNCYNLAVMELSEDIEPLIFTETLRSNTCEYSFADFSKPPKEILSVTYGGKDRKFTVLPDKMVTDVTECEVKYDYRAARATSLTDAVEYDEGVFSARVLAMGTASEYLLVAGLYEEAATWRERYEKAIETYLLGKKRQIKARRWA